MGAAPGRFHGPGAALSGGRPVACLPGQVQTFRATLDIQGYPIYLERRNRPREAIMRIARAVIVSSALVLGTVAGPVVAASAAPVVTHMADPAPAPGPDIFYHA